MDGVSNTDLVISNGLSEEIWEAFKNNKLLSVETLSTNNIIIKINNLVTDWIDDTASINYSPSYYHNILKDCIPNTIKGQIFSIIVKGLNQSSTEITLSSDAVGNWVVQSDCGIIQFFGQLGTFTDNANVTYTLFANTAETTNQTNVLFTQQKTPIISFYKYMGKKGTAFIKKGDVVWNCPLTDGNAGQILKTDGEGNLSFIDYAGAAPSSAAGNANEIQFNDNGNFGGDSRLRFNNTDGILEINSFKSSEDTLTGALVIKGGVGIEGDLNVGGTITGTWTGYNIEMEKGGLGENVSEQVGFPYLNNNNLSFYTVVDEDDMTSNSDTAIPTQQSVKTYIDNSVEGLNIHEAVQLATTNDLLTTTVYTYNNGVNGIGATLTKNDPGIVTIDGSNLNENDRILVKNQSKPIENGIYIVTILGTEVLSLVLTRADDANSGEKLPGNSYVFVEGGTININNGYVFNHTGLAVFGSTELIVSQFSGSAQLIGGIGINKIGNEISVSNGLLSIVGLATENNKMIYTTDVDTYGVTDLTEIGRDLLSKENASGQRNTLELGNLSILNSGNITENLIINKYTKSTNTESGSLVIKGGVGIEENINIGGIIKLGVSNLYKINFEEEVTDEEYYELGFFNKSKGQFRIKGILSGSSGNRGRSTIDIKFSENDIGFKALGSIYGETVISSGQDIIVYDNNDNKHYIYLKVKKYPRINLDVQCIGKFTEVTFDKNNVLSLEDINGLNFTLVFKLSESAGGIIRIDNSGNLGLGKIYPENGYNAKLDVEGSTRISNDLMINTDKFVVTGSNGNTIIKGITTLYADDISSNINSGGLIVKGGIGIAKSINIGETVTINSEIISENILSSTLVSILLPPNIENVSFCIKVSGTFCLS